MKTTIQNGLRCLCAGILIGGISGVAAFAQTNPLVTGKRISLPPIGVQQNVGSLPMNLLLSPDERYAVVTDMGFRQSLWTIDTATGRGISHIEFPAANKEGLYYGLALRSSGNTGVGSTLFAAQGAMSSIAVLTLGSDGKLTKTGSLSLKDGDFAAGIALDRRGYLYVAINEFSTKSKDVRILTSPGSLAILDTKSGMLVSRYKFGKQFSNFPLAVEALADGSRVYVTSQRDSTVSVLNTVNPAMPTLIKTVATGSHPDALKLNRAQTKLFIANAHSDTVSILDTATNTVIRSISIRPAVVKSLIGATPTGLALAPDEKTLYVTLGDMNAVAVVDLTKNVLTGMIPTGWYPSAVAVTRQNQLLFANAKGTQVRNPNGKPVGNLGQYGLNIIEGSVTTVPLPDAAQLKRDTGEVLANNHIMPVLPKVPDVFAKIGLPAGKIKHVVYVVKENRTYDQVLGDLTDAAGNPVGNGDPSLAIFGKRVTPNAHALALRFVTLDNFYDCGEASGDGWPWSTQGIATEYVIKNLPYNYSGRGRLYDFEGQVNGQPVGGVPEKDADGEPLVSPGTPLAGGAPAIPDVSASPAGHIWDSVLRARLTLRNYGFFYAFGQKFGETTFIPDNYPAEKILQPGGHDLAGKSDVDFREFDTAYPDSDGPQTYYDRRTQAGASNADQALYPKKTYGKHRAISRFAEWNTEFQQMLAKDPTGASVPNFMMLRLMHDHTQGVQAGMHTPDAEVADNDYGVGQLVEAISKSPVWESTAIFVIEDDAQDGHDHVDSHRSVCYVISPYIKQNSVDHTFYNTDSVLRTMELLLGLPPMTQYDAFATPILDWDTAPGNNAPYAAILPDEDILCKIADPKNKTTARLAAMGAKLDFIHPDSADPNILNAILWKYARGLNAIPPKPVHKVVFKLAVSSEIPDHKTKSLVPKLRITPAKRRDVDD